MARVLGIEKNSDYQNIMSRSLSEHQLNVFSSLEEAKYKSGRLAYDLGIMEINHSLEKGLADLKRFSSLLGTAPVIVTSERDDADWIVKIIRAGAYDFIVKPFTREKLRLSVERILETRSMRNEIDYLRRQQDVDYDLSSIVAKSPVMMDVMYWAGKYAETESNLMITGETGTGKSYLAGAIHFNSPRKKKPFIKINCANLPETLLESELFGHEKGAFTDAVKTRVGRLEQASGGTVFLDEIGEMSAALQAKFLQVVEDKCFERVGGNRTIYSDIRIIVATNRNLPGMVDAGDFRSDLYYRLNVLKLHLPPLRKRRECIEVLTRVLLDRLSRQLGKKVVDISPEAIKILVSYSWPGNIRELANVIERALLLENSPLISEKNIHVNANPSSLDQPENSPDETEPDLLTSERQAIIKALDDNLWVQNAAASQLGISPRSLNYKVKKLGITHWRWRRHKPGE